MDTEAVTQPLPGSDQVQVIQEAVVVHRIRIGELELHEESCRAVWKGMTLSRLTLAEFRVLKLVATAGRYVTHREIYDVVKGPGFISGDGRDGYKVNVRTFIKRIRNKIRAVDPEFDRIQTYNGFGYAWRSPATEGVLAPS